MGDSELTVLVVDDDFRVADMHAGFVTAVPGFRVTATVNTFADAQKATAAGGIDLALVDVYLPDGSGIELVRQLRFDAIMLTAATGGDIIRGALAAGALGYLVKPFTVAALAARLAGYARYRRILNKGQLRAEDLDAALEALRPGAVAPQPAAAASPTQQLVLQAIQMSNAPISSAEVSTAVGISRATAQRHLATLVSAGKVKMRLRYGRTGRPKQEFLDIADGSDG